MNIVFLYRGHHEHAPADWVRTMARYVTKHKVTLCRSALQAMDEKADYVFPITEAGTYPRDDIDHDIAMCQAAGIMLGVVHNNDNGVPRLGHYPSFVWTELAMRRLKPYEPTLVRQPVLPPCVSLERPAKLHVATFGVVEPKKAILEMGIWAKSQNVEFTVFGLHGSAAHDWKADYQVYLKQLQGAGIALSWYQRMPYIEDLSPLFEDVSHFLFVNPPAKEGTGGSPTSPRYATAFGRPVLVVDDEPTFKDDGFYVFPFLDDITAKQLEFTCFPLTSWGPEQYVQRLVTLTSDFYVTRKL